MLKKLNRIKVEEKLKLLGIFVFTPREFQGVFDVPQKTASFFISSNTKSGLFVKLRNNYYMLKKLNRIKVEEKLKLLGIFVFTPREFQGVFDVSQKTASCFISSNTKSGLFIKLRNNYYMLKDSNPSLYFIANKLYQPSYISLEKALSHHGIIPEIVYTVTSITTKTTRECITPKGAFSYQKIKRSAFTGYNAVELEDSLVLFAEPEKALADYLYFVDLKKVSLNNRLELKEINKKKLLRYIKFFERPSLINLIKQIYVEQKKPRKIY